VSLRAWSCFAAVSVLWGIPYLFTKLAVDELSPWFVAWSRVAIGAVLLLPVAWRLGLLDGLRGRMRWAALWGMTEIAIPFPLVAFGQRHVSSSLTAILIAATPLLVAVFALRLDRNERPGRTQLAGLIIGLVGVIALVGIDVAGKPDELLGAGAILLGAACYAVGPFIIRGPLSGADSIGIVGVSLGCATVVLTPLAIATWPSHVPDATAISSVVVLGVACTAAALVLFAILVAEVGGSRAIVITYVAPVVAVALGVTVLGESLGAGAVAGLLLILAGSWLATDGRLPPGLTRLLAYNPKTRRALPSRNESREASSSSSASRSSSALAGAIIGKFVPNRTFFAPSARR
jgi:drug/metabolite transporter (DMT)-like permease